MKKILALAAIVALSGSLFAQTPAVKTAKVKAPIEKKECSKKSKTTKATKAAKAPASKKAATVKK